jgi:hypothetical protein
MFRRILATSGALLGAFHVWLFASQLWEGQLADLTLVLRWGIAIGLVAALLDLRRRGRSMLRGRPAIAIWVLAALLHGPALARDPATTTPALPEVATTLAQLVSAVTLCGTLLLLGLAGFRRRPQAPRFPFFCLAAPALAGHTSPTSYLPHAPRPPPHTR